jgi:hypothetical protein
MNAIKSRIVQAVLVASLYAGDLVEAQSGDQAARLRPFPCRIADGRNADLWFMTFGDVETPVADGVFDVVQDRVALRDGAVKTNYYRDVLGVKFYQPLDKSRFPTPPSGWCTWYYYYTRVTEQEVVRNAEWLAANLKDYGAQYVQIDDGWQGSGATGSPRNWAVVNTNNFPHGMAWLAGHIRSLGLTPGLWLAPHGQNSDEVVKTHPGVFLLKPNGASASETWEGRFLVDPTHPATEGYFRELFQRMCDWGYDYFKIDGQPIVVEEYGLKRAFMHAPSEDAAGLYRQTVRTIRDTIGPNRYLLGCWGIPLEGAGIMNGSRTGGDIVLGWGGFQVALRPTLQYYYLHNVVWYSDPDVVLVRSPLPLEQARVWATLAGLTGQALMSSDRLMDLGPERVELLRRIYPATDIRPLDLFPTDRYKRIWDLKVNHLGRKYDVVGVFNFDAQKADSVLLNWQELGLPGDEGIEVYDFWNREYLGRWQDGMAVPLPPASCRVLTLLPAAAHPQLISTSRHITQGPVDLVKVEAGNSGAQFGGVSRVVRNDPYKLSFVFGLGTNQSVAKAMAKLGHKRLPVEVANHQGWAEVGFTAPQNGDVEWQVRFGSTNGYAFPSREPVGLYVQRVGLAGADVCWQEQYYLNEGYVVWLDGKPLGQTSEARFPLRGLEPSKPHTVQVRTASVGGGASQKTAELTFELAALLPAEMSLKELEPLRVSGLWDGYEIEGLLPDAPMAVAGQTGLDGLKFFANSESEYELRGLFNAFTAQVGVDARSGTNAAAEFIVLGDGRELWRSGVVKRGDLPKPLSVTITGVNRLVLRTVNPGREESKGQADWVAPRLKRAS